MPSETTNLTLRTDKLMKEVTLIVDVTIIDPPLLKLRRWLAIKIILFSAWLLGCNVRFITHADDAD